MIVVVCVECELIVLFCDDFFGGICVVFGGGLCFVGGFFDFVFGFGCDVFG